MVRRIKNARRSKDSAEKVHIENLVRGCIGDANNSKTLGKKEKTVGSKPPDTEIRARNFRINVNKIYEELRVHSNENERKELLDWMHQQVKSQVPPRIRSAPLKYEDLLNINQMTDLRITDEIVWIGRLLVSYAEDLRKFRQISGEMEKNIWGDNLDEAFSNLDELTQAFGRSLWETEARIAILQKRDGLEKQKEFVKAIKTHWPRTVFGFLAQNISARNEPSASISRFAANVNTRIDKWTLEDERKLFIKYRLRTKTPDSMIGYAAVLKIAQSFAPIDLYEIYIDVLQDLVVNGEIEIVKAEALAALRSLRSVNDYRVEKLLFALGDDTAISTLKFSDWGEYSDFLQDKLPFQKGARETMRERVPSNGSLILAAINLSGSTRIRIAGSSFRSEIIKNLAIVVSKSDRLPEALSSLQKVSRNYAFLPTMKAIAKMSGDAYRLRTLPPKSQIKFLSLTERSVMPADLSFIADKEKFLHTYGTGNNVRQAIEAYQTIVNAQNPDNPKHLFVRAFRNQYLNLNIPPEPAHLVAMESSENHLRLNASLLAIDLFINAGSLAEAVGITAPLAANESVLRHILPVEDLFTGCKWPALKPLSENISLPIALDAAWRINRCNQIGTLKRLCFEAFLQNMGFERPSKIPLPDTEEALAEAIYFLRYFCIIPVMNTYGPLSSSRDVEEERIAICERLTEIDAKNLSDYETEIASLKRQHMIIDSMKIVDSSRIYVDLDAIRAWAQRELREPFTRYTALVKAGVGIAKNMSEVMKDILATAQKRSTDLLVPNNEADSLLVLMVESLRDKFLYDPIYGLDSYLSKRVRHGSFIHHLRNAVEKAHLVTKRNSERTYHKNTHWPHRLTSLNASEKERLQKALLDFNFKFDALALSIRDELLHIKSAEYPKGMFALQPSARAYEFIRAATQSELDFAQFLEQCFSIFWGIIEQSLIEVRVLLEKQTKEEITQLFYALGATSKKIAEKDKDYSDLVAAIKGAAEETRSQVDQISAWFNQPSITSDAPLYSFRQGVEMCMEITRGTLPMFKPKITNHIKDDGASITGSDLVVLYEIVSALVRNVAEHSGLTAPRLFLEGGKDVDQKRFRLSCYNDISSNMDLQAMKATVMKIKSKIAAGLNFAETRKEGNSGLIKIASVVLQTNLGKMNFDFHDLASFSVELEFCLEKQIQND